MMRNQKRRRLDRDKGAAGVLEEESLTRDLKRRRIHIGREVVEVDRLIHLPRELIDCILKHLPVQDAARTSILSRTWRHIWATHPHLLLGDLIMSLKKNLDKASRVIDRILLLNNGPILDFHLVIPRKLHQNTHSWIKHASSNGVRNLKLINLESNATTEIPSRLFDCSRLTDLSIVAWILNPPYKFGGFRYLINVKLIKISITADMSFGPQLEVLKLIRCTGIEHLRRQFMDRNNLKELLIGASKEIDWRWFEQTQKLECFALTVLEYSVPINLNKLLRNMSNIHSLYFNAFKFLESGPSILKRLTTTLEYLSDLQLYRLDCNDFSQISYAVCLMRSSPNMRYLLISLVSDVKTRNPMELTVEQYIRTLCFRIMILDRLQVVEIRHLAGSRANLHFIKLLLASSPSLRRMSIFRNPKYNDPVEETRFTRELMMFDRASSVAQIIWT